MKVVCISTDDIGETGVAWDLNDPQIGEECEIEFETHGYNRRGMRIPCYKLVSYDRFCYDQRNFAISSNIDEKELLNERVFGMVSNIKQGI